jgi:hypothetical protein
VAETQRERTRLIVGQTSARILMPEPIGTAERGSLDGTWLLESGRTETDSAAPPFSDFAPT